MGDPVDELIADALTTVRLVPRWQLEGERWPDVEAALQLLEQAVLARDRRAIAKAMDELEDFGPTRLAMIGRDSADRRPEREPPPKPVLDLVNHLVHPEGGWTPRPTTPPSSQG